VDFARKLSLLAAFSSTDPVPGETNVCSILAGKAVILTMTDPLSTPVAAAPADGLTTRS
jgi:hypothetical protein